MADQDPPVELITYQCREFYVYAPLPPVTSFGHRAELWGVDDWFKAVAMKVVTLGEDQCRIRLEDLQSGELFAECPLPSDGTPLTTAVEPVVDSSRYFVLRVVDNADGKHAFIGVGFRDRNGASAFTAALDDYRQFLRRQREAAAMREQFEALERTAAEQQEDADAPVARSGSDFSLKDGQTIKITLKNSLKQRSAESSAKLPVRATINSTTTAPAAVDAGGPLKLPLPPPPPPPSSILATGHLNQVSNPATPTQLSPEGSADQLAKLTVSSTQCSSSHGAQQADAKPQQAAPDDWGDFVG